MMHDRVITISLDTTQCDHIGCVGIVFNIVTIDGIKFSRCVNCGKFTLLTSERVLENIALTKRG